MCGFILLTSNMYLLNLGHVKNTYMESIDIVLVFPLCMFKKHELNKSMNLTLVFSLQAHF
jgi:hypothetical protein